MAKDVPDTLFRRPMLMPSPMRSLGGVARSRIGRGIRDMGPLPVNSGSMLLIEVSELRSMRSPVGTFGNDPSNDSTSASPVRSPLSV